MVENAFDVQSALPLTRVEGEYSHLRPHIKRLAVAISLALVLIAVTAQKITTNASEQVATGLCPPLIGYRPMSVESLLASEPPDDDFVIVQGVYIPQTAVSGFIQSIDRNLSVFVELIPGQREYASGTLVCVAGDLAPDHTISHAVINLPILDTQK